MTSNEIISRYGLRHVHAPVPEEIARALSEVRRLRAQAFGDSARATAAWLTRVFRGRAVEPAQANVTRPAPVA